MKIYYTIKVHIATDNKFIYEDKEYELNSDCEKTFYFHNRLKAIESVKRSYKNLLYNIKYDGDSSNIPKILEDFEPWFNKVCIKVPLFDVSIQENKEEISYRLGKIAVFDELDHEDVAYKDLLLNTLRLNILKDWKTDYNWYSIDRVPDARD